MPIRRPLTPIKPIRIPTRPRPIAIRRTLTPISAHQTETKQLQTKTTSLALT
jgi:hypothetical protein